MKKYFLLYISALFFPLFFQSCLDATESDAERQIREDDAAIQSYFSTHDIDAEKLNNGIYAEILKENEDGMRIVEDHVVGILYSIIHLEGEYEVEVHSDTLNPLRFSNSYDVNDNAIYPAGLNYEISGMREGEKYRFYVPSYQAFGNYSHNGLFDSYSNFIIEVEVAELKTEEEIYQEEIESIQRYISDNNIEAEAYPNGLYYSVIAEGAGEIPAGNSQVELHYTRKYLDGTVIESSSGDDPVTVNLNNGELVRGFEDGVKLMREGEKAILIMPSKIAFGKSVQVIPQKLRDDWAESGEINPLTRPYSSVIYEVELIEVN